MSKRMSIDVVGYLSETYNLTTTQHGAYLLLMLHYWREGELPHSDEELARVAKLPLSVWVSLRSGIQSMFSDGWKHARLDAEIQKSKKVSAARSECGQRGAVSRWQLQSNC